MKYSLVAAVAAAAVGMSSAAQAVDYIPGSPQFQVSGNPFTGTDPVSASIGSEGLSGTSMDRFLFVIGPTVGPLAGTFIGLGSGSVTTTYSGPATGPTNLDFGVVEFWNGFTTYNIPIALLGKQETGAISDIPIYAGVTNILTIHYFGRGQGSYGGTLNFIPVAVPEPASWALLTIGVAAVGMAMRRRSKYRTSVSFS